MINKIINGIANAIKLTMLGIINVLLIIWNVALDTKNKFGEFILYISLYYLCPLFTAIATSLIWLFIIGPEEPGEKIDFTVPIMISIICICILVMSVKDTLYRVKLYIEYKKSIN